MSLLLDSRDNRSVVRKREPGIQESPWMGVLSVSTGGCYSTRLVFVLVTSVAGQIAVHCKIIAGCACFKVVLSDGLRNSEWYGKVR